MPRSSNGYIEVERRTGIKPSFPDTDGDKNVKLHRPRRDCLTIVRKPDQQAGKNADRGYYFPATTRTPRAFTVPLAPAQIRRMRPMLLLISANRQRLLRKSA
jgi:hypothetical protein